MIDFRYHLVSIVAVLLALSIGVVLGTGVLGGPLLEDIERNVAALRERNAELQDAVAARDEMLQTQRNFASQAEPLLLRRLLEGEDVVLVEMQGIDGAVMDGVRDALDVSGAEVSATIEVRSALELENEIDVDLLALALGSVSSERDQLILETGRLLGDRIGLSLQGRGLSQTLELLDELEEAGFAELQQEDEGTEPFPPDASVVIVGGNPEDPRYEVALFASELAARLGEQEVVAVIAEPVASEWGLVTSVRRDGSLRRTISTADGVSEPYGRIALMMALEKAAGGENVHLGSLPGAETILPRPEPGG